MDFDQPDPYAWMLEIGINQRGLLHASQYFLYEKNYHAGDSITVTSHIADIYEKKNGRLVFVVKETLFTNDNQEEVAEMRSIFAVRQQGEI